VVRAGTPLRDRAGSGGLVVRTLSRGEAVDLLRREGGQLFVRTASGHTGFLDAVSVQEHAPEAAIWRTAARTSREPDPEPDALPFGLRQRPGERLVYHADFLYDPFGDRALIVTTRRVIVRGGGAILPRVLEAREIVDVSLREGSTGLAPGEVTLVLETGPLAGTLYVSGLYDPHRALAAVEAARGVALPA
jgi:hypothetical protein